MYFAISRAYRERRVCNFHGDRYYQGCSHGVFFTEALAESQHVNCMIVRIFGKSRELHAMLGLKLLLRKLPEW